MNQIYTGSTCLIAASLNEGFGLPLIEAARHELPIIACDIHVFHEVAGEHAFYFTGNTPPKAAEAIAQWLDLYKQGKHPSSKDMPWLTWKESATRLLESLLEMKTDSALRTI